MSGFVLRLIRGGECILPRFRRLPRESCLMSQSPARSGLPLPPSVLAGFFAAILAVRLMAGVSFQAQGRGPAAAPAVTQGVELIVQIQNVLSSVKDAETGQRGYLLTGDEAYLEPFTSGRTAVDGELGSLRP